MTTRDRAEAALQVPLLDFLGARLADDADPAAGLFFVSGEQSRNAVGFLHGGIISTALDVAGYLAVLPELDDDEEAITHALLSLTSRPSRERPALSPPGG